MWICAIVLNFDRMLNPEIFIYYPLRLCSALLLFWLAYQGFYNYSLMAERVQLRKVIASETPNKYSLKETKETHFLVIKKHIEASKRFLDPAFSLESLATEMEMSTSKLSSLLNQESGHNFSDYINNLRVEKAKEYLISADYATYTIVAIGLECGFNSKSTFYSAFKKFTNTTPSNYKAQNL
jgi:AraC-like DNA-binding protein